LIVSETSQAVSRCLLLKEILMPTKIDNRVYYRTLEVCRETGISRATLFRWISLGILPKLMRDRRGWRLFTEADVNTIKAEVRQIKVEET
jgi:predicted DNA-binding transcriptional regulator AlpA